jgi:toxin-antitoxin system PIN domain toxin
VRALFDVNVLIAAFDEEHVLHERAQQWWAANRTHGWASCPLTQNGFVRIVSQPNYPNPISVEAALELFAEQIAGTDHAFWPDDISLTDTRCFDGTHILGPKQLTDVYLLALAVKNGGRLATLDHAIPLAAVRGAQPGHVVVI